MGPKGRLGERGTSCLVGPFWGSASQEGASLCTVAGDIVGRLENGGQALELLEELFLGGLERLSHPN